MSTLGKPFINFSSRKRRREPGTRRSIRKIAITVALSLAAAIIVPIATPGTASAFCEKRTDGSTCHAHMVETAVPFLRGELVDHLRKAVLFPDDTGFLNTAYRSADHFDSCNFSGGTRNINDRIDDAIDGNSFGNGFSPDTETPEPFRGISNWAAALHGAQDFYAHSNWIEMGLAGVLPRTGLGGTELVDSGLGSWTELDGSAFLVRPGVFHFNGNVPTGWTTLPHPTLPTTRSVTGNTFNVLISGEATDPTQDCPNDLDVDHDDIDKDNINQINHLEAQLTAIRQTRHEWCRLLHLASDGGDYRTAAVLMGLMVQPGESPHPARTACAPDRRGSIGVTVSVDRIRILDDHNNNGPGDLNLTLGLFTTDFRRSTLSQAVPVAVTDGGFVPSSALPSPVSLCLDSTDELVATVQGWEDDGKPGVFNKSDDVLVGTTRLVGQAGNVANGSPLTLGSHTLISDSAGVQDLEVSVTITNTGAGCRPERPEAIDTPDVFTDSSEGSPVAPPTQRPSAPVFDTTANAPASTPTAPSRDQSPPLLRVTPAVGDFLTLTPRS